METFPGVVLTQYVEAGVGELDEGKPPHLIQLKYRAVSNGAANLVGIAAIRNASIGFQGHFYS